MESFHRDALGAIVLLTQVQQPEDSAVETVGSESLVHLGGVGHDVDGEGDVLLVLVLDPEGLAEEGLLKVAHLVPAYVTGV